MIDWKYIGERLADTGRLVAFLTIVACALIGAWTLANWLNVGGV